MKKLFRKILLLSFSMTSILSIMSISITAEEFKQSKEINYKLRTDVHPKRIYIDGKSFYSEGIPKRYREYKEEHDGVIYSGKLTLTEYQDTGDGYLGLYSGYIYR